MRVGRRGEVTKNKKKTNKRKTEEKEANKRCSKKNKNIDI